MSFDASLKEFKIGIDWGDDTSVIEAWPPFGFGRWLDRLSQRGLNDGIRTK